MISLLNPNLPDFIILYFLPKMPPCVTVVDKVEYSTQYVKTVS